ncbi:MAG TPA: nuclear transport factor 2 family protein [Acidimicrobiia bacterium]|nr:nuclear transport factor 2 family protein [Acidimicrobiia bacterium]
MPDPGDALQDTIDYVAITRLQNAYADAVTRRAWAEFHDMFLPDAPVSVDTVTNPVIALTGPQAVGDFIGTAVERFEFFEFVPLSTRVTLRAGGDPDRATARLYICELRQDSASGHATQAFGVYQDDHRRVDGRWWFAERAYQSLARSGRGEVFEFPKDAF